MKSYAFLSVVALLSVGACGPTLHYVHTGPVLPPLAKGAHVEVYLSGAPTTPYREIGMIEIKGDTLDARVAAAQEQARARGGNGIVLLSQGVGHRSQTTTQTVKVRDGEGKVKSEREVPRTEVRSYQIQTFAVISVAPSAQS